LRLRETSPRFARPMCCLKTRARIRRGTIATRKGFGMRPQRHVLALWIALLAQAAGCDGNRADSQPPPASRPATSPATTLATRVDQITSHPLTVQIELPADLRAMLQRHVTSTTTATTSAPVSTIRLTMEKTRPVQVRDVMLRVFLNNPNADRHTPVTDPSYVGSISFFPVIGADSVEPRDYVRTLGPALQRLAARKQLDLNQPLQITFVPVPVHGGNVPTETRIRFSSLKISAAPN